MSSIYETIEQAVADRLAPFGGVNFDVQVLPQRQADYRQRPVKIGRITVAFHSSEVEKANSIGGMNQRETITIAIAIQSKDLRGNSGVYTVAGLIRQYLVGFKPEGHDPIRAKAFGLKEASHEDNLWTYYAHFYTTALAVQDCPEETLPLLQQINLINQVSGETVVIPEQI